MEGSPDERVKTEYPRRGFIWPIAMKLLALPRVLWLEIFFPLGPTGYQWSVGTNSLKYVMEKTLHVWDSNGQNGSNHNSSHFECCHPQVSTVLII